MASHGNLGQHSAQQAAINGAGSELQEPIETPWGPVAAVLLCLLPIALLLVVTLSKKLLLPSSTSLPLAAVMMAVIRLAYLSSPPLSVMASVVHGVLDSATPLSVIYGAILLFEVMQHTKCLSWMMSQVKSLSAGEPLAEVFLIGWAFSYMISGVGGFNTPIALSAPMLSSLGHDPMLSLMVVVVLNTLASHMGSVGMAIWFGFKTLGLSRANILAICLKSSVIVGVMSFIIAPISASFLVPWRQLMRRSLFVSLSIMSAVVPTALVAIFNAEFPVLIGGMCSIIITALLIYYRVGLGPRHGPYLPEVVVRSPDRSPDDLTETMSAEMTEAAATTGGTTTVGDTEVFNQPASTAAATGRTTTAHDTEVFNQPASTAAATGRTRLTDAAASSAADLRSLATLSCPLHDITSRARSGHCPQAWNDLIIAESDSVSNPIGGLGCEGLWEDNHSAVMTALPASLVAATIHHASLSGVSRVPWFAGVGTGLAQAGRRLLGRQQQLQDLAGTRHIDHQYFQQQQRQALQSNASAQQGSDAAKAMCCEIDAATTADRDQLFVQDHDSEDLLSDVELGRSCTRAEAAETAPLELSSADLVCTVGHMQQHKQQYWWQTTTAQLQYQHPRRLRFLQESLSLLIDMLKRTLPIWLTVLLLLLTRIPQLRIQGLLQSTHPSVTLQLGSLGSLSLSPSLVIQLNELFTLQGVNWKYEVLYVPCLLPFVVAGLVTMTVNRNNMQEQQMAWTVPFVHAAQKMKGTLPAIIGAMVLSDLISSGGVGSPAFIIGHQLSTWLGRGYLAVAGFLGALGSFVSGSMMAGNMTFGGIQKVAAERVGVSVTSMLAVHTAGSCAGKMMCISNILSAKVMMNLPHLKEGKIIRRTAPLAVMFVVLSQVFGLLFTLGAVWPDTAVA